MKDTILKFYIATMIGLGTLYCIFIYPKEYQIEHGTGILFSSFISFLYWIFMFFVIIISIQIIELFSNLIKCKKDKNEY